jgi:hypothetical protein
MGSLPPCAERGRSHERNGRWARATCAGPCPPRGHPLVGAVPSCPRCGSGMGVPRVAPLRRLALDAAGRSMPAGSDGSALARGHRALGARRRIRRASACASCRSRSVRRGCHREPPRPPGLRGGRRPTRVGRTNAGAERSCGAHRQPCARSLGRGHCPRCGRLATGHPGGSCHPQPGGVRGPPSIAGRRPQAGAGDLDAAPAARALSSGRGPVEGEGHRSVNLEEAAAPDQARPYRLPWEQQRTFSRALVSSLRTCSLRRKVSTSFA